MEKSDNELIAKFMGAERREGPRAFNPDQTLVQWIIWGNPYNQHRDDVKHWYQPVELKYHESWDWLMPVVEKISFLYDEFFHKVGGNTAFINKILGGEEFHEDDHYMEVIALPVSSKISEVYKAVVAFIKWYNSQSENV